VLVGLTAAISPDSAADALAEMRAVGVDVVED
jgi:hypothetical protein